MLSTKKQIRDFAIEATKQDSAQIGSLVNNFINMSLDEVNNPAWAFDRRWGGKNENFHHLWSWLKRKTTFATVIGTEDYVLERDVDKIAFMRQTTSPRKLTQIPDEIFFREHPNPTESGNPRIYRIWAIDGVSTKLAAADLIDLVSSSSSDGSAFTASVLGYVSGRLISEAYTLNGATAVAGTNTFDAREIFVSKSGVTTGNITFRRNADSSTLVVLGPQEVSPRFKVVTLFPKPSSVMTIYLEYYKRIRELVNDSDAPEFDPSWHYVVILGTVAKIMQHLGKTTDFESQMGLYASAVRAMVAHDKTNPDLVEYLRRNTKDENVWFKRSEENPS